MPHPTVGTHGRLIAGLTGLLLAMGLPVLPGHAGMSAEELMVDPIEEGMTEEEREARREAIERERQAAEERRREREAAERAEREAREAELAARPYPVRLTERRCMECHDAGDFDREARTWPGWAFTVWRMRLAYGAELESGEWRVITDHLAETHGAPASKAAATWTLLALTPILIAALLWYLMRGRRQR
ncbi:hypothetical protein [Alkalilimnicola ehrlichii]|uniref:hypothetical protein n=1 Tax=Alkalilimnicola ehrlichii TaxID=351052 RepID=UPI003BA0FD3F